MVTEWIDFTIYQDKNDEKWKWVVAKNVHIEGKIYIKDIAKFRTKEMAIAFKSELTKMLRLHNVEKIFEIRIQNCME